MNISGIPNTGKLKGIILPPAISITIRIKGSATLKPFQPAGGSGSCFKASSRGGIFEFAVR